jgi:hypothetical protein
MAPRKLDKFKNLPKELRLEVWKLASMDERIIRATVESMVGEGDHFKQVYHLTGGPLPKVLQINRESRVIGLEHYTAVRSYAALNTTSEKWFTTKNEYRIYINFDVDTLYFLNLAPTYNTMSWLRRIPKEEKKESKEDAGPNASGTFGKITKPTMNMIADGTKESTGVASIITSGNRVEKPLKIVKHIALASTLITAANVSARKLDFLYGIGMQLPFLRNITIIVDNSTFHKSKFPHTYSLKDLPPPLKDFPQTDPNNLSEQDVLRQSHGGRIHIMLKAFWDNSELMGNDFKDSQAKKYREWKASEKGKNWVPPIFKVMGLAIDKKKSKLGQ